MLIRGWTLNPTSSWMTLNDELSLHHHAEHWRVTAWKDEAEKLLSDAGCQYLDTSLSLKAVMEIVTSVIGPVSRPSRQGIYQVVGIDFWIRRNRDETKTSWYFVPNTMSVHPWNELLYKAADTLRDLRFDTRYNALIGLEKAITTAAQDISEPIPEELQLMMAGEPAPSVTSSITTASLAERVSQ